MILFGTDNPHYHQTTRLVNLIERKMNQDTSSDTHWVILGDFNLPHQLYGFVPNAYEKLRTILHEDSSHEFTFPAISSDYTHVKRIEIDHAFFDPKTRALNFIRLPLQGSDHYPLLMDATQTP